LEEDVFYGVVEIFEECDVAFDVIALFTVAPLLISAFESSLFFETEL
jgi:hypothetical protein